MKNQNISFPAPSLPVAAEASIVVVGGGVAGVAAAVAAGRLGSKVILLEQNGCCGGMTTVGLLPSIISMTDGKSILSGGLCKEVVDKIAAVQGGEPNYSWQNLRSEELKVIFDEMLEQACCEVFYETTVVGVLREDGKIRALDCWSPGGRVAVTGKYFIDATGDGNLSMLAGASFLYGNEDHQVMAPTLCLGFDNIDYSQNSRCNGIGRNEWSVAMQEGTTPVQEGHFVGFFRNGPSEGVGNLGHIYNTDVLDLSSRSNAWREGRKLARIYQDFFRNKVAGFADAQLCKTGEMLGVRESRRITGDYVLSLDDYRNRRHFTDDIGSFAYPIDIHAAGKDLEAQNNVEKNLEHTAYHPGENYGIPYRSILVHGLDNLLVAGRCISTDRAMQASVRVVPGCMITGEAAGTAAAMAFQAGQELRQVNIQALQVQLRRQGLFIPNIGNSEQCVK